MTDPDHAEYAAYASLAEAQDDNRWAFGTGFSDPLAGVDTTIPEGAAPADLATYCLMLGDDALVLSQRLAGWLTHAPELEEEVALANVGLDLLGQARILLARAAAADPAQVPVMPAGSPVSADDALAYFRDQSAFCCVQLVETPDTDFADCVTRLLVFATWRLALLEALRGCADPVLSALAVKGVAEVTYHRDYAARWVETLGIGTEESRRRMQAALPRTWRRLAELFDAHPVEERLAATGVAVDPRELEAPVRAALRSVLVRAGLEEPEVPPVGALGGRRGRDGVHTEALGLLLAEMQSVARMHSSGRW